MARKTLIQVRRDTDANWTSANPTLAAGEWGFETNTGKVKMGDGSTNWAGLTYFIPGVGAGGSTIATDTIWDTKGDLAAATGADTAQKLAAGSNGKILVTASGQTTGLLWDTGYLGGLELVYKYTVAGSDKASIDTGADSADAGTSDWSNGDVLEVWILGRLDNAGAQVNFNMTLNNDTGSNYDLQYNIGSDVAVTANKVAGGAQWALNMHAAGGTANYATAIHLTIPGFTGTTFYKTATALDGAAEATGGNNRANMYALGYRSTSAVTRLKIAGAGSDKFKVGSQLLIYKRRNA